MAPLQQISGLTNYSTSSSLEDVGALNHKHRSNDQSHDASVSVWKRAHHSPADKADTIFADSPSNCDAEKMVREGDVAAFDSMAAMYAMENPMFWHSKEIYRR